MVAALRRVYQCAEDDRLITMDQNPARRLRKPRRPASTRRAVPDAQLAEINRIAADTGPDPALDSLLVRFHVETACRRGGALALRACDLDRDHCLVTLREKGCTQRAQPVSPTLMKHLIRHADERGGAERPDQALFRQRNGRPITRKHYETLWRRIRADLPWAARHRISAHWLRHTTLTWVERTFSPAVARAYAGHSENSGGVTGIYTKGTPEEVATALAALTGEPHPLADQASDDDAAPT
jgi:integrase